MKVRIVIYAIVVLIVAVGPVAAWSSLGHKAVAEIAWQQLDDNERQEIVDVLRRHPRFAVDFAPKMEDDVQKSDKAAQDHWVFLHAATWPDQIRRKKDLDRPDWHYIDLPQFLDDTDEAAFAKRLPVNIATEYPPRVPLEKMNVLQAIEYCRAKFKGNDPAQIKAAAYCWLFHLVGDVHQPLHTTALFSVQHFPKGDKGGNDIPLARGKNLHALWDTLLGTDSRVRNVRKVVGELQEGERFREVWDTAANESDPKKWAQEGHDLCYAIVYSADILAKVRKSPPGNKLEPIALPEEYYRQAGEIARKRVIAAGLRLGAMLKALGSNMDSTLPK